ncbi:MAG TPA: hypothetical protein PLW93_05560, partial [Candidatus Absconditabacterales bacterium]|nr:hypothetical protein [Candidatus Absconditabacterales bacterium]
DGQERLMIEGYIRGVEATLKNTVIKIEDYLSFLDDKLLYTAINFNGQVDVLLQTILDQINAREDTGIILECNVTDTISKQYAKGDSVLSVLKDLRENNYEFVIRNGVLIFKTTIGTDRTLINQDYREFMRDVNSPLDRTIRDAKMVMDIKQMCNCGMGKNGSSYATYEDIGSINEYGRIERCFTNNGNITQATQNYVNERNDSIREFDISPNVADFFYCDLGDIVRVYINSGNDLMFYDGTLKVIEKSYTAGEMGKITFKLSQNKVKAQQLNEKIKELHTRVRSLELK